jgi:hypothetical protein
VSELRQIPLSHLVTTEHSYLRTELTETTETRETNQTTE